MNPNKLRGLAVIPALALVSPCLVARAQDDARASGRLEEITVTARKREENLQDVPATITAISQDMLERGFFQDVRDVQNAIPNIVFDEVSTGSANNAAITLRGVGFQDVEKSFDPAVGVMIDGMFMGSPNGAIFKTLDVERIEVLRGPQGTLFGKNTIGGLIHVIRQKPRGEFGGSVRLGVGRFGRQAFDGLLNFGEFNDISVKATLGYERRDGYFTNVANGDKVGDKDFLAFGLHVLFEPSEGLSIDYRYDGSRDNGDTVPVINNSAPGSVSAGVGVVGTGPNNANSAFGGRFSVRTTSDYGDAFFDFDSHILTTTWDLHERLRLKYILGRAETDEDILNNFAGFNLDTGSAPDDQFYTGRRVQHYEQTSHEMQLIGALTERIGFVGGVYFWDAEYTLRQDTFSFLFGPSPGFAVADQVQNTSHDTRSWSVFGEFTIDLGERFQLSAGLRHIDEKKSICSRYRLPSTGGLVLLDTCNPAATDKPAALDLSGADRAAYLAGLNPSASWEDTIFRVSGRYDVSDTANLWLAYSTGFKSGGFNGRGATLNSAATPYQPETVKSIELGLKSRFADSRVQLNATYFNTQYDDLQVDANRPVTIGTGQETFVTNAASARIQGIEVDSIVYVTDNLTVMASAGWLDASYDDFTANIGLGLADNTGLELRRAPELTYNVNGVYRWTLGPGEASVRLNYAFKSDYHTLLTNNAFSKIESYGLLDASFNYAWGERYLASVFARNLTDEDYFTHAFAVPVNEALWNFATPREPRIWGVEFRATF